MGVGAIVAAVLSVYAASVLYPTSYESPDGTFALEVDPGEPDGSGPAWYRLTQEDESVWEAEHPYTFFENGPSTERTR